MLLSTAPAAFLKLKFDHFTPWLNSHLFPKDRTESFHQFPEPAWDVAALSPSLSAPHYPFLLMLQLLGFSEVLELATYLLSLGLPHALLPYLQCSFPPGALPLPHPLG